MSRRGATAATSSVAGGRIGVGIAFGASIGWRSTRRFDHSRDAGKRLEHRALSRSDGLRSPYGCDAVSDTPTKFAPRSARRNRRMAFPLSDRLVDFECASPAMKATGAAPRSGYGRAGRLMRFKKILTLHTNDEISIHQRPGRRVNVYGDIIRLQEHGCYACGVA